MGARPSPKKGKRGKPPAYFGDSWLLGFYFNEVSPRLDRRSVWPQLEDRGESLKGQACGKCGRTETYTFPDSQILHCAHLNSCGHKESILDKLSGGTRPSGDQLLDAVEQASKLAGVIMRRRDSTPEDREKARLWGERKDCLEAAITWSQELLWSPEGQAARDYLASRGFEDADMKELGLGFFGATDSLEAHLESKSLSLVVAGDAALLKRNFEGYVVFPWLDEHGNALTIYGRWPGKSLPLKAAHPGKWKDDGSGSIPKTYALPGEHTKADPLYFNRVKSSRTKEVVLVEGVIDAAIAQVKGDARVCAYVAGTLSSKQVECVARLKPETVILCPDPDAGGDRGVLSAIKRLSESGLRVFVAPRLSDGKDPDEFILEQGIDQWKQFLELSQPGPVFLAWKIVDQTLPNSPPKQRESTLRALLDLIAGLSGDGSSLDQETILDIAVKRCGFSRKQVRDELSKRRKEGRDDARSGAADIRDAKSPVRWVDRLIWVENKSGSYPSKNLANALTALGHHPDWSEVLAFNEFSQEIVAVKPPPSHGKAFAPESFPYRWGDHDDSLATAWLQRCEPSIDVQSNIAAKAVQVVAQLQKIHPVRDYLLSLEWDGKPRLDAWLADYCGAAPAHGGPDYLRAVGAKWMIAAVARVFEPGCKMDTVLVLEGKQGIKKSTAFKILGGEWFTDELADVGSKDSAVQLQGAWIIELAELDALSKAESAKIKSFFTRTVERYVPKYAKHTVEVPRQCVFAGTVNPDTYLKDETGNRRWWPVRCSKVDVAGLIENRDQLWAEAVARYQAGEKWYLDESVEKQAKAEQDARYRTDAWEEVISGFAENLESVTIHQILQKAFHLAQSEWGQREQNRVAQCLKRMGWERKQVRMDAQGFQDHGLAPTSSGRAWVYARPPREPGEEG